MPLGLKNITLENNARVLRNRHFIRDPAWKLDRISSRLAVRATSEIKEIEIPRSKTGLKNKMTNDYNT